ncbi:helix-turn-helix domain-containing protein [Kitasatospora sp. HPMI-4]|uniref:helix-turn-helix domain-containing protein n=1 Tax=Kitasatospora sp. HPMI-4 TaxID=3448443 RepID=UPI003F198F3D
MREKNLDPTSSPAAAYAVQLRRSRKAKGYSQTELAKEVRFSGTYLSYLERAERAPTLHFSQAADVALETGGTLELMWWHLKHTALLEGFPEYVAQEQKATEIRIFGLGIIPGLLQTSGYAAALAAAAVQRGSITQTQAEERIEFHVTRQRVLERTPAPLVHAVLDESCLRRPIGGPQVMADQLQFLTALAGRSSVIIQAAPFALAELAPFTLGVMLLTLPDRTVLGYSEAQQRGFLERTAETVRAWERDYHRLQVEALPQASSLAMIRAAREELHA